MSEVEELAAAAGIEIIGSTLGDGQSAGLSSAVHSNVQTLTAVTVLPDGSGDRVVSPEEAALEVLYTHRYTMDDPDYASVVSQAEWMSNPPCVAGFKPRRPWNNRGRGRGRGGYHHHRNDNRSWSNRDGGDQRGSYRDNYNRNSYQHHDNRSWREREGGDERGYRDNYNNRENYGGRRY